MNNNNEPESIQKQIIHDNLIYSICVDKKTAEIIGFENECQKIMVPRSITYELQEYIVTSICEDAFENSDEMESIQFSPDSELRTIQKNAFAFSSFERIEIPSSVVDLEEGWCNEIMNVNEIYVSPENKNYASIDGKFIIGKSSKEKENFDVLVFSVKNIKNPQIPDFIEIIGQYAFAECYQIKKFVISPNSKLKIIEKFAFYSSSIESITIPPHLTKICEGAFYFCDNFQELKIPSDSELQIIEKDAFYLTLIKSIEIPSKTFKLEEDCFNETQHLNSIFVSPDNQHYSSIDGKFIVGKSSQEKENYDVLLFSVRNIEKVKIPDSIEIIGSNAFANCKQIKEIEISANSKLRIIGKESFSRSSIEKIKIPPQITQILEGAFFNCQKLQQIEIPENSELQTISEYSFHDTLIENIVIPSSVIELKDGWCAQTPNLNKVKVMPNNKFYISINDKYILGKSSIDNINYNVLVFVGRDIQTIKIPDSIEIIGSYSFANCKKLYFINFPKKLATIQKFAFYSSLINGISFPSSLTQINESAFSSCQNLQKVTFPKDSNLALINEYAFAFSPIESIFIPSNVSKIALNAFYSCSKLQIIEFGENSKLNMKEEQFYKYFDDITIMLPFKSLLVDE